MKKARIMLIAIAVSAIAGSTLAFKVKFDIPICYVAADTYTTAPAGPTLYSCTLNNPQGKLCPNLRTTGLIATETATLAFGCYTHPAIVNGQPACPPPIRCPNPIILEIED